MQTKKTGQRSPQTRSNSIYHTRSLSPQHLCSLSIRSALPLVHPLFYISVLRPTHTPYHKQNQPRPHHGSRTQKRSIAVIVPTSARNQMGGSSPNGRGFVTQNTVLLMSISVDTNVNVSCDPRLWQTD